MDNAERLSLVVGLDRDHIPITTLGDVAVLKGIGQGVAVDQLLERPLDALMKSADAIA